MGTKHEFCKRGHLLAETRHPKYGCMVCVKLRYCENWEKVNQRSRDWAKNNPNRCKDAADRSRLRRYGWTPETVAAARIEQADCCAICRTPFTETPDADHVHVKPPKPRGLLCNACNVGIGLFKDSPEILEQAVAYLRKY
jgi:hypothetical protein